MRNRQDRNLDSFTRTVLKRIAVEGLELPVVNDRGETQVVTAMDFETIPALTRRLVLAGGYANVFISMPNSVLAISVLRPECALTADRCTPVAMPSNADTTVGMFVEYLLEHPEGVDLTMVSIDPSMGDAVAREASELEKAFV